MSSGEKGKEKLEERISPSSSASGGDESLQQESAELRQRSLDLKKDLFRERTNRELRLATLNLMEDFEDARRRVEKEIAERKRIENSLREREEQLRLIVENARDFAIFSMDLSRRVTTWNSGAQQILGYSEAEIIGQTGDIIFTEEDRASGACQQEAETALREGRATDKRWHCRKDRSRFWGSGVMMAMQAPRGETIGFVKILRDETEEKKIEDALQASRAELENALNEAKIARQHAEAANRTKDLFLAMLSHELRTPLVPIRMTVDSFLRRNDLPARVQDGLKLISRNLEVEVHLISDLLDLTRIARNKFELARESVNVHDALNAAIEICQSDFTGKSQGFSTSLEAGRSTILGDYTRLQQVFWNLLKNASKFTPEGGDIRVQSRNEHGKILVILSDTGEGISPETIPQIFKPFRQGDISITRRFGGLGLGLAIANAAIDAMGGTIVAESAGTGRGAVFTVALPLAENVPASRTVAG